MDKKNIVSRPSGFGIGLFLINVLVGQVLIGNLVFLSGNSLAGWQFPAAVALAAALHFLLERERSLQQLWVPVTGILIIAGSVFTVSLIYDTSWDGQGYHQEMVYQLGAGWNPFYEIVPPYPEAGNQWLWVNHYPKALELCEAGIYRFTGRIETAKATNLILWAAAFGVTLALLRKLSFFSGRWNLFYALLFTACPVLVNQVFTFYIDGQLYAVMICLFAVFVHLSISPQRAHWCMLAALIFLLVSIKFTSIVFAALFTGAYVLLLAYRKCWQPLRKLVLISGVAALLSFVLAGYNPYIVSLKNGRHVFYPVMGVDKVEIMGINLPRGFEHKGRIEKLMVSLFSYAENEGSWVGTSRKAQLKVPFSFRKSEIAAAKAEDTRIAGFGPFFSGALLITFFTLLWATVAFKRYRKQLCVLWYALVVLWCSVLLLPEAWWARFVPQLWLVPALVVFTLHSLKILPRLVLYVLIAALSFNITLAFLSFPSRLTRSVQVKTQLEQFRLVKEPLKVQWGESRSVRIRLLEENIPFQVVPKLERRQLVVWSDAYFSKPENFPLPAYEPLPLKWLRKFKSLLGN